jgi:nicotinamide-nucleotide amidase
MYAPFAAAATAMFPDDVYSGLDSRALGGNRRTRCDVGPWWGAACGSPPRYWRDARSPRIGPLPATPFTAGQLALARALGAALRQRGLTIATAESCTAGLVGALLTSVPGASDYYLGGAIVYANSAKARLALVDPGLIDFFGAVSDETARAMASGILEQLGADIAVSTTGIAGPGGGSAAKPVGLVYVGVACADGASAYRHFFAGHREQVRGLTVAACLHRALATVGRPGDVAARS